MSRLLRSTLSIAAVMVLLILGLTALRPYLMHAIEAVTHPDLRWIAVALIAELVSMAAFGRTQRRVLRAGGVEVRLPKMIALAYAANALNASLPAGSALAAGYSFRRMRSWGASHPLAGFTLLASGLLSTATFGAIAVAVAVTAGIGGDPVLLGAGLGLAVLAIGAAVLGMRVVSRRPEAMLALVRPPLRLWNRLLRRAPETGLAQLRAMGSSMREIHLSRRDWTVALCFAALNWIADFVCLIASCRAVGIEIGGDRSSLGLAVVAYVAGMSASSLSLLPGGLGTVDAAMILAFSNGGVAAAAVSPAVLLYRLVSMGFIVAVGWLLWTGWWSLDRRARRTSGGTAGTAQDPVLI